VDGFDPPLNNFAFPTFLCFGYKNPLTGTPVSGYFITKRISTVSRKAYSAFTTRLSKTIFSVDLEMETDWCQLHILTITGLIEISPLFGIKTMYQCL